MKHYIPLLLSLLLLAAQPVAVAQAENGAGEARHGMKRDCDAGPPWCKSGDGMCRPEMRGRCGKRRGDWYGARQPVVDAAEARALLLSYFSGQEYTVSEVTEKKWGFRATILDKDGKVIDRVMIDRRSGRIRSLD
jgi:hypothetical protein